MSGLDRFKLDRNQAVLLVVDVQDKLIPAFAPEAIGRTIGAIDLLLRGAETLGLPVVATEQYPQGLGNTVAELAAACSSGAIEKVSFGCCGEPEFMSRMHDLGRSQVIVTGVEAHVCVYQTVLGLLGSGYHVHLVQDAVCSRRDSDRETGLGLAREAGAVLTSAEVVLFQLLKAADVPEFKAVSKLVRNRPV